VLLSAVCAQGVCCSLRRFHCVHHLAGQTNLAQLCIQTRTATPPPPPPPLLLLLLHSLSMEPEDIQQLDPSEPSLALLMLAITLLLLLLLLLLCYSSLQSEHGA
jgi:hypothetical protein